MTIILKTLLLVDFVVCELFFVLSELFIPPQILQNWDCMKYIGVTSIVLLHEHSLDGDSSGTIHQQSDHQGRPY